MAGASKHQPNSRANSLASLLARVTSPGLFSLAASQAGDFSNRLHVNPYTNGGQQDHG